MEVEWEGRGVDEESPACGVAVSAWKRRSAVSTTLPTHRRRPGSATVPAGETCDPGWKRCAHAIVDVFRKTCEWK